MASQETSSAEAAEVSTDASTQPKTEEERLKSTQSDDGRQPADGLDIKENSLRKCLRTNLLALATFAGVLVGVAMGLGLRSFKKWDKREVSYVNFPGELFLNILNCLVLPLIVSSLIAAVGSLDTKISGKIGMYAMSYYLTTTVLAIILGIVLVTTIQPGVGKSAQVKGDLEEDNEDTNANVLAEDTLMDLVRNMFPPNIMEATVMQRSTVLIKPENETEKETTPTQDMVKTWDFKKETRESTNILGIVVFTIVLGIVLAKLKERGKPMLDVFVSLCDAMMLITRMVVWLAPVCIPFLVASKIVEVEDLAEVMAQLALYTVTVVVGISVHGFVVLSLIYYVVVRKNPLRFIANMGQALATAFGTASSSATLPITIMCLEENNLVDARVARFVLPIGATINMDGTALYESVSAIFISQVRQRSLDLGDVIAISITATTASIGAAGIPQAGLITMVMVLNVVGLPTKDVALILMVDWALDRFRTVVNVLGDSFGAAITARYCEKHLAEIDEELNKQLSSSHRFI